MDTKLYPRGYLLPGLGVRTVQLPACTCGKLSRGPEGGVCGRCSNAILTETEKRWDKLEDNIK